MVIDGVPEVLGELVDEGDGLVGGGAVDGVDGVGDEEPLVQLEVVGGGGDEDVEELAGLQYGLVVEGVRGAAVVGGGDGGDGGVELGVDGGPEDGEVDGGGAEDEGAEDHVYVSSRR